MLRKRSSDVTPFVVNPVQSISKYKVPCALIAYFNLSQATDIPVEIFFLWKLLVLHWKNSNAVPLMGHTVDSIFKLKNVLNLTCWFSFETSCPSSMFKNYLFLNFGCSVREASFFLWSALYTVFSTCKVFWYLTVDFTLSVVTQIPLVKLKTLGLPWKKQRYW